MSLPLALVADQDQVERLRPLVQSRACVLVGSAPLTAPIVIQPAEVVIAINGAISSVPLRQSQSTDSSHYVDDNSNDVNSLVDVWFLGSKESDKPGDPFIKPLHRQMLEQAWCRRAGHVVFLRGPKRPTEHYTLGWLSRMQCTVQTWSVLDKPTKRWMEGTICDRRQDEKPCSSGILAVACALWCGAEAVRLEGFSFQPGYHYVTGEPPQRWWRNHVEADRRAVRALTSRYPGRLSGALISQAVAA